MEDRDLADNLGFPLQKQKYAQGIRITPSTVGIRTYTAKHIECTVKVLGHYLDAQKIPFACMPSKPLSPQMLVPRKMLAHYDAGKAGSGRLAG